MTALTVILWLSSLYLGRSVRRMDSENWIYENGGWCYEINGMKAYDRWIENGTYYLDADGRMLTDEWVYTLPDAGIEGYTQHSHNIPDEILSRLDKNQLYYVGHDGRKLRNKTIYFTQLYFDAEGRCTIDPEAMPPYDKALENGFEGLRRYAIFEGNIKEFY